MPKNRAPWARVVRIGAVLVGILCVLVGAADLTTRLSNNALGEDTLFTAFAPAAALFPSAGVASSTVRGPVIPARLLVPALGINAGVEMVGKVADGSMGTPQNFKNVGWYSLGAKPGGEGSAVFDGHVNNALTQPGAFANLSKIKPGDYVTVQDSLGRTLVYKVASVSLYEPDASTEALFYTQGPAQLVLITCGGQWLQSERQFDKRLVVVAKPAY